MSSRTPAAALVLALCLAVGCGSSVDVVESGLPEEDAGPPRAEPTYDFAAIDAAMQEFIDGSDTFDGISYTLVDAEDGTVHEAAFGDHSLATVVQLASTSKMPTVTLLMALQDDESLGFDLEASIDTYLPWEGVYGDRTTAQLVSNTSGIPGLGSLAAYGFHLCQFVASQDFDDCAQTIYGTELPGSRTANTGFDYGGSQWQLSGAVAEQVSGMAWNDAFDAYVGEPCGLEVFTYGNPWADAAAFDGTPGSLIGTDNPNIEGGAISSLQDYAKLLLLHLREGRCGDTQVASADSLAAMRVDRGSQFGTPYGMSWWILPSDGTSSAIYYDPGAFGAISWIDMDRGIGGYIAIDDYSRNDPDSVYAFALAMVLPLQQAAVDAAR